MQIKDLRIIEKKRQIEFLTNKNLLEREKNELLEKLRLNNESFHKKISEFNKKIELEAQQKLAIAALLELEPKREKLQTAKIKLVQGYMLKLSVYQHLLGKLLDENSNTKPSEAKRLKDFLTLLKDYISEIKNSHEKMIQFSVSFIKFAVDFNEFQEKVKQEEKIENQVLSQKHAIFSKMKKTISDENF